MTVVRPNSIAGINSITVQTGQALNIHDASGNLIRNITSSSGVSTFSSLHVGSGTTTNTQGISVGTGCSIVSGTVNTLDFYTNNNDRLRIHPGGQVSIRNTNASSFNTGGDDLVIGDATDGQDAGITLYSHSSDNCSIFFNDTASTGVTGLIQYRHDSDALKINTAGSERLRIDSSGRLLIGHTSSLGEVWNNDGGSLQVAGTSYLGSTFQISRWTNSASCPHFIMGKSRGGAVGTNVVVQDDDTCGIIAFAADDGTDLHSAVAEIRAQVDGTPGSNDTPGRLIFSTTADGANSRTEHLRIDQAGRITIGGGIQNQEAASFNSGANQLLITSDGATGLTIDATSGTSSSIHFADGATGSESYRGIIEYNHGSDYMSLATAGTHRVVINSTGDVNIAGVCTATSFSGVMDSGTYTSFGTGQYVDIASLVSTDVIKYELLFTGVSCGGGTDWQFQLGDAGGVETSGYEVVAGYDGSNEGTTARTDAFRWTSLGDSSFIMDGKFTLTRIHGNKWWGEGNLVRTEGGSTLYYFRGSKELSAALTKIHISASSDDSESFDGGHFKLITYKGSV